MRKHARRAAGVGVLCLLVAGCSAPETAPPLPEAAATAYFPLKQYLDAQAAALNQRHPAVRKRVRLRNTAPETARVPQVDWTRELQIFYQADINKPALRGAYAVDSVATADGGQRLIYTRRPGIKNPVAVLRVEKDAAGVRAISATLAQNNPLFSSEKQMELRAQNGLLTSYAIQGVQKLVLFDTVRYTTAAQVE